MFVTDNVAENMNEIFRETMMSLNITHITTSPHRLQSNSKIERFHRLLGDILSKMTQEDSQNCDL